MFRVIPIDPTISNEARKANRSPQYGHPAHIEQAKGYGPCRSCLDVFQADKDSRLLFTYNPFDGLDAYPSPGPIFIHTEHCEPYDQTSTFPHGLRNLPLTLEGYGADRHILSRERPSEPEIETAIEKIFANDQVLYIHVRNTDAGCFIARIER